MSEGGEGMQDLMDLVDEAKAEAGLIQNKWVPVARELAEKFASVLPDELKDKGYDKLVTGKTAVLEIASQLMDIDRESHPEIYASQMVHQDAVNTLAGYLGDENAAKRVDQAMSNSFQAALGKTRSVGLSSLAAVGEAVATTSKAFNINGNAGLGILFNLGQTSVNEQNTLSSEGKGRSIDTTQLDAAEAMNKQADFNEGKARE